MFFDDVGDLGGDCAEAYFAEREPPEHWKDTSKPRKGNKYRCTRCGQYKPKSEFYKDTRVPCGIRHRCKACYHK
ncbi:MAG: hypothetical protein FWB96_01325 [Defluviitaleaceae bacterium]|nr:hypothetical protein [Defluviitaleaceae bacterium]MCL2261666.1 hypothetical protein [Defluviitaleaceae bacterium]